MEWMTHLVSIAIGVALAFFFLGGDKSKAAETASAPASSGAAKKKKKKNKKKVKAAEPVSAVAAAAAAVPVVKEVVPVAEEKPVVIEKAAAPAAPTTGGKKKKNKKKNSGAAKATPAPTPAPVPVPEPKPEVAKPAPAPKPAPAIVPLQPRIVVEEEWATIPKKSKKKKKPVVKAAAAAASSDAKPQVPKASVTVTIDASRIGIIIGPKGATMNAIQEKTGTKLDVNAPKPEENGSQFRPVVGGKAKAKATIVITEGTSEGMALAKKAILELADRGYAALLQAEGFGESSVSVHPRFLSEIVGTGGKIIKAIQTELDVKLTIPKTDWTPKTIQIGNIEPSVRVGIAGDIPANVKKAKQVIKDICAYHHHPVTHPGLIHQEIFVPHEFFHCVIGTRGSEIKHIRGNYKVEVYMPSNESWCVTENVICVGKSDDVEKAISYIKLLMDRDSELREQKYSDEDYGDDSYGW